MGCKVGGRDRISHITYITGATGGLFGGSGNIMALGPEVLGQGVQGPGHWAGPKWPLGKISWRTLEGREGTKEKRTKMQSEN